MLRSTPVSLKVYCLALAGALVACGTGSVELAPTPTGGVKVQVAPSQTAVIPGGAVHFVAAVSQAQETGVIWSVLGAGTIDASGVYTAPGTTGQYRIVATSVADPTVSAAALVYVSVAGGDGTYVLAPDRITTWRPGVTYNGGIPNYTTISATLTPSGGDDRTQLQNALNAAGTAAAGDGVGRVVKLNAGTFLVTDTISIPSKVVLRGAGPGNTSIEGSGARYVWGSNWATVVEISSNANGYTGRVNLAGDAVKGSSTVTLASNPGLAVGEIVLIDQLTDGNVTNWGDQDGGSGSASRGWFCRGPASSGVALGEAAGRPTGQMLEVASVSGNTVTFSTPFHMTYSTANTAQLLRYATVATTGFNGTVAPFVKWAGIEEVRVAKGTGGDGGANIAFHGAAYSWARHVETDQSAGSSVSFGTYPAGCFRCELRDSYVHDTINPTPGGDGYGISLNWHTSETLVENNISVRFNKVMVMRATGGGNVIAYNYMDDGWMSNSIGWMEVGLNASHMAGAHYELFEGNSGFNFDADSTWGNATSITVLRNHLRGHSATKADTVNRRAAGLMSGHWWYSFVGNVLGYSGMPLEGAGSFAYEQLGGKGSGVPMWELGYSPITWSATPDPKVISTILRDGNYDYATRMQHWHGIGGTGASQTTAPAASLIPSSLYLPSKPTFFGSNTWPWVDPATGSTATLPAKARFDAGTPNVLQ